MEPLRDPNPSDLLEVREPSELVVPQGLSRLSYNLPEHLITSSSINPGCGWGAEVGDLALGGCTHPCLVVVTEPGRQRLFQTARKAGAG